MALIISDANIFIDLECAGLTARMFRLNYEFAAPDLLYNNELSKDHGDLPGLGLQLRELSPELIQEGWDRRSRHRKLSIFDLFALVLARAEGCPLLTGDKFLRADAEAEGITVYGTLWLMERLFEQRFITFEELEAAYAEMRLAQRRLPGNAIKRQLKRLRTR